MNKLLVTLAVGSLSGLTSANAADVLFVTGSLTLKNQTPPESLLSSFKRKFLALRSSVPTKLNSILRKTLSAKEIASATQKLLSSIILFTGTSSLLSSRTIWTAFTLSDLHTMLTAAS